VAHVPTIAVEGNPNKNEADDGLGECDLSLRTPIQLNDGSVLAIAMRRVGETLAPERSSRVTVVLIVRDDMIHVSVVGRLCRMY
jgi:hypothetical protein